MKLQGFQWYLSIFLLLLFLGGKGLEYHPLTHSDENAPNECELCDFAILDLETPYTPGEEPTFDPCSHSAIEVTRPESSLPVFTSGQMTMGYFCRPPPSPGLA